VCGTDKRYGEQGAAAVTALREAGIEQVLLAGPEKIFADVEDGAARPDGFLTARIDAVAALTELLGAIAGDNE
jgi:methylmalonyl-CoA mutase